MWTRLPRVGNSVDSALACCGGVEGMKVGDGRGPLKADGGCVAVERCVPPRLCVCVSSVRLSCMLRSSTDYTVVVVINTLIA